MKLEITPTTTTVSGISGLALAKLIARLSGEKSYSPHSDGKLTFQTNDNNVVAARNFGGYEEIIDRRSKELAAAMDFGQNVAPTALPVQPYIKAIAGHPEQDCGDLSEPLIDLSDELVEEALKDFLFERPPLKYQKQCLAKFRYMRSCALFAEQGTGKTKIALDLVGDRFLSNKIEGLLIITLKGIHNQWVDEKVYEDLHHSIEFLAAAWDGKRLPNWHKTKTDGKLQIFSVNVDVFSSDKCIDVVWPFIKKFKGKFMVVIDESQIIANASSQRSKNVRDLCESAEYKMILTGTPIPVDLLNEWAQFLFLDPKIIGIKYKTAFRSQFCIMGGFQEKKPIGMKNLDQFKSLVRPYIYRITKREGLGLPEKIYDGVVFEMSDEQKKLRKIITDDMKNKREEYKNKPWMQTGLASSVTKLQQISCGFYIDEDGNAVNLKQNPRLDTLENLLGKIQQPIIIWARFRQDIKNIMKRLGDSAVSHYGEDNTEQREEAKLAFRSGRKLYFVATPATAGTGVDGLQNVCSTAIYYSNSYNAIHRWQSEDRIDRIGMIDTSKYFDLIARASEDRKILANLRGKKNLSDLVLDDFLEEFTYD